MDEDFRQWFKKNYPYEVLDTSKENKLRKAFMAAWRMGFMACCETIPKEDEQ